VLDLLIVGCGPVGAVAANLAGVGGLSTVVLERAAAPFPLPRAIHFDAHIMRILQQAGVAQAVEAQTRVWRRSTFYGADSRPIRVHEWPDDRTYGWDAHYLFYQPTLEAELRRNLSVHPNVELRIGVEVTGLTQLADGVRVSTREPSTGVEDSILARYVIGADGASSFVRGSIGCPLVGSDFDEPWLVIDLLCERELGRSDESEMFCDPARPATRVPGPGNHHRWEFMLLPGESAEDLQREETIAELLKPWVTLDEVQLLRASVYRFHSLMAVQWRDRRVFLAGDAAHQTPPFLGQGMCHGIRDVHNLLTKLAAVAGGGPAEALLSSYEAERRPHVQQIIDMAVSAGREICLLDPAAAAQRDRRTRAAATEGTLPRTTFQGMPPLSGGLFTATPGAGELFPQPQVQVGRDHAGRFDDAIAPDIAVVARPRAVELLRDATAAAAVTLVALADPAGSSGDEPVIHSAAVSSWLRAHGGEAAVIRPDRYVYGTTDRVDAAERMVNDLRALFPLRPVG
jgi:3-(3-hydroxy-phenyl)propionate hydroxylase